MRRPFAVAVALGLVLLVAAPAQAASVAAPSLVVSNLKATPGEVQFLLTPRNLPAGTSLDPAAVQVRVDQAALTAKATPATDTAGAPARALSVIVDATGSTSAAYRAAVVAGAAALVKALPPDVQLGLFTVTNSAVQVLAPTVDRTLFTQAVAAIIYIGATDPVDGVEAARTVLAPTAAGGEARLLLISDGREVFAGPRVAQVGANVVNSGLALDVVSLGASGQGLTALTSLATAGGGHLLTGADQAAVAAHWQSVGQSFAPTLLVTVTVPTYLSNSSAVMGVDVAGVGSASVNVLFGPPIAAAVPAASGVDLSWVPGWVVYLVALLVFVALVLIVLAAVWPRSSAHERIKQIAHFGPGRPAPVAKTEPVPAGSAGGRIARTALAASAQVVRTGGLEERSALTLERAGMKLRPHEWLLLRTVITVASGVLFGLLFGWIFGLIGLILGLAGTFLYQSYRVDRRSRQFAEQLPDALQLVIGSLRSGFSLSQALESLVRESPQPVGHEFGRALAEHRLGADISDGLDRVAQRTRSEDLSWAVMAVRIQRDVGGNLAEILQTSVETMRERGRLRRHVRSLSAEGRLSAWVLIAVPLVLGGFMALYRRSYIAPLVTDPRGIIMLIGGSILFVIGIFWMTRVIRVEA